MTDQIPPVRTCGRHRAGHDVHWIQARLTWSRPVSPTPVEVLQIGDAHAVLAVEGGLRRFQNHDLIRLQTIVEQHGPFAALVGYGTLSIGMGHLVSVKDDADGPLDACGCRP